MSCNDTFEETLKPHMDYLFSFAKYITGDRTESKDLVQKTVIRAMDRFDQYEEGTNLRAWLSQIMKNLWIDEYRSRSRRSEREYKYVRSTKDICWESQKKCCSEPEKHDEETLLNKCVSDKMRSALLSLPEKFRRPLLMHTIRDLKYEEIAEELDCPLGTVRSRLHRAKELLKEELSDPKADMEPFRRPGFPG